MDMDTESFEYPRHKANSKSTWRALDINGGASRGKICTEKFWLLSTKKKGKGKGMERNDYTSELQDIMAW